VHTTFFSEKTSSKPTLTPTHPDHNNLFVVDDYNVCVVIFDDDDGGRKQQHCGQLDDSDDQQRTSNSKRSVGVTYSVTLLFGR
jgi:hypothetical protein